MIIQRRRGKMKPYHITKRKALKWMEWQLLLLKEKKYLALQRDIENKIEHLKQEETK